MKRVLVTMACVVLVFGIGCAKKATPVAPGAGGGVVIALGVDGAALGGPALLKIGIKGSGMDAISHESWLEGPGAHVRQFFVPPGANRLFMASLRSDRVSGAGTEFDLSHVAARVVDINGGETVALEMLPLQRYEPVPHGWWGDLTGAVSMMGPGMDFGYVAGELKLDAQPGQDNICYLGREGVDPAEKLFLIPSRETHPNRWFENSQLAKLAAGADVMGQVGDWYGLLPREPGSLAWLRVVGINGAEVVLDYIYRAEPNQGDAGGTINP